MKKKWIKIMTLFSGYDAQIMAVRKAIKNLKKNLGIKVIGWSDIDRTVRAIHNVVFPEYANNCYPDVREIPWGSLESPDILFYSSPCQSLSRAGQRKGMKKGTETEPQLIWTVEHAIATLRPKYCILENVEGMLDADFSEDFISWCRTLSEYGYANSFKVLSSADFGVPQNRKRIFLVSIRIDKDDKYPFFQWPKPYKLTVKPEDLLEDFVDDEYYLSCEEQDTFIDVVKNAKEGYSSSVTRKKKYPTKLLNSQFYKRISAFVSPLCKNETIPTLMVGLQSANLTSITGCRRDKCPCVIEVWEGPQNLKKQKLQNAKLSQQVVKAMRVCPDRERILATVNSLKTNEYLRVRYITPTEALRFMGVDEQYIKRIIDPFYSLSKEGLSEDEVKKLMTIDNRYTPISNYAIYGRAGNSIVVDVLAAITEQILNRIDKASRGEQQKVA